MFVINQAIAATAVPAQGGASSHRHYRTRNEYVPSFGSWPEVSSIPDDEPFWSDIVLISLRKGLSAAKQSLTPACWVWGLMAMIAFAYYCVPATHGAFETLDNIRASMGLLFPFLGMGLSVGILAELVKVLMSKPRRWTKANTINAVFNLMVFGVLGIIQDYFYIFQCMMFGEGNGFSVLLPKVLFDQFVWTVFFANPYQTLLFMWKSSDFRASEVTSKMKPFKVFWGTKILPVLVTNWAFWIPMVSIIYCFPSNLQLPLVILSVTIWVLLLSILTQGSDSEESA